MSCVCEIYIFFPNYKVLCRTELQVFLRNSAGFLLENCNLALSLIKNIPLSKILCDLYYASRFDGVILTSGSAIRHVFYSGTCIPQVPKSIFSHIVFFVAVEIILRTQHALGFPNCTLWDRTIILTLSKPLNYFRPPVLSKLKFSSSSFLYSTNYHTIPL